MTKPCPLCGEYDQLADEAEKEKLIELANQFQFTALDAIAADKQRLTDSLLLPDVIAKRILDRRPK